MNISLSYKKTVFKELTQLQSGLNIYCRGYIIWEGRLYCSDEFIPVIAKHFNDGSIFHNVKNYNGGYNIVILSDNKVFVFNDRWGMFPMYYVNNTSILHISNDWKTLLPHSRKIISKEASVEMLTFGYVMGSKTLIDDICEFEPHCYYKISLEKQEVVIKENNYWEYIYTYKNNKNENEIENDFADLWNDRMSVYTDYVKTHGNLAYIPLSGGMDSRLLLSYFDNAGIDTYAMTFGSSLQSKEVIAAQEIASHMQHLLGHNIIFYNKNIIQFLNDSITGNYDQLTCAHFENKLIYMKNSLTKNKAYFIPGHDANYMAGENLKLKMYKWNKKEDIINYILEHKSSKITIPITKKRPDYDEILRESLKNLIPDDPDHFIAFNRWNGEQRQRRYIIRSSIPLLENNPKIFMPFFDYEIMDFFCDLPLYLLLNQRLYINAQLSHLYKHDPELLKIGRDGGNRQKRIRFNYYTEYYPKIKNEIYSKLGLKPSKVKRWSEGTDYSFLKKDLNCPDYIDLEWIDDKEYIINLFYVKTISDVNRYILGDT